jgi:hypothetical protein
MMPRRREQSTRSTGTASSASDKTVDTPRGRVHHRHSYGTQTLRRTNAPGPSPVEFRRGRVLVRLVSRPRDRAGATGVCQYRQVRRALVRHSTSRRAASALPADAHNVMRAISPGLEPWWCRGLQNRRPEVRLLPSLLAPLRNRRFRRGPRKQARPAASRDASTLTTTEASQRCGRPPHRPRMGRSRRGGAAGCRPVVFRRRRFDSSPAHHARHA